eukprot:m.170739 g.170739  ORF g.170739 m.170739 type:complete len:115 (-) comp14800_c0_seq3:3789-4133(-)
MHGQKQGFAIRESPPLYHNQVFLREFLLLMVERRLRVILRRSTEVVVELSERASPEAVRLCGSKTLLNHPHYGATMGTSAQLGRNQEHNLCLRSTITNRGSRMIIESGTLVTCP